MARVRQPQRRDTLLAPLRRHRGWTALGLIVALVAAGTRFVSIGVMPPSIKMKPFGHATASTELLFGESWSLTHTYPDRYVSSLSTRAYTLADMVSTRGVANYVAHAAGLPVSKIGIVGPLWTELQRSQQWATGPKRASQIVIENDPYHITLSVQTESPPFPPVIAVQAQAPTEVSASKLAGAVGTGLTAYLQHLQISTGDPPRALYRISQVGGISVLPARKSQLANVGAVTFLAVFLLWCGLVVAASSLMRDLRAGGAAPKVEDRLERSSDNGAPLWKPTGA